MRPLINLTRKFLNVWRKIDYWENFKPFKNVYGVLDITFWIYIAFGMTPYSRIMSPKGNFIYYNSDKKKYILVTWYMFLMLTAMSLSIMKEMEEDYGTFIAIINIYLHSQVVISGIITLNMFTARAKILLEAYKDCYKADREIEILGLKPCYVGLYRLTLLGIFLIPLISIMQLSFHLQQNRNFNTYLRELFVYGLPTVITVIPSYHIFYLGYTALDRFQMLNNHLVGDITLLNPKQIEYHLLTISNIHH